MKTFTLLVKVPTYYEVNVKANSIEEAVEKSYDIKRFHLVTKTSPVDSDPLELISVTKQDV